MSKPTPESARDHVNDQITYLMIKQDRLRERLDFRFHHEVGRVLVDVFGPYDDSQARAALQRAVKRGYWEIPLGVLLDVHRLASEQPYFGQIRERSFAEYRSKHWGGA